MRTLAQSKNFVIEHECETAYLWAAGNHVVIGDFYGDPQVAIIDKDERWCAIGGHGLIIYWLEEPFSPFNANEPSLQYLVINQAEAKDSWWVDALEQTGPKELEVQLDRGARYRVSFDRTGKSFMARVKLPSMRFVLFRWLRFLLRLSMFKLRRADFSEASLLIPSDWLVLPETLARSNHHEKGSPANVHIGFAATPYGRPVNITILASSGSTEVDWASVLAVEKGRVRAHHAGTISLWICMVCLEAGPMRVADISDLQVPGC